ncbi:unnamed protein product [Brugia pahangi]|uniref:Uncharacterized protein n=1 Tax=Brugia pahangi TaxID=6280 RepID=A0A0N4TS43_BRUPA|nr:unnamed protein product [Brugia pahangi]
MITKVEKVEGICKSNCDIGELDGVGEKEECKNGGTDEETDERSESDVLRVRKRGFQDENNPGIL